MQLAILISPYARKLPIQVQRHRPVLESNQHLVPRKDNKWDNLLIMQYAGCFFGVFDIVNLLAISSLASVSIVLSLGEKIASQWKHNDGSVWVCQTSHEFAQNEDIHTGCFRFYGQPTKSICLPCYKSQKNTKGKQFPRRRSVRSTLCWQCTWRGCAMVKSVQHVHC